MSTFLVYGLYKDVFIHLDKFSNRHNLLHVGVSFHDVYGSMRFDFRPNNKGKSYLTTTATTQIIDMGSLFLHTYPVAEYVDKEFAEYRANRRIETRSIYWGKTLKSWDNILSFEKYDLSQRYVIGVYDCRHYVKRFTYWSTGKGTPVWSLHRLWEVEES